MCRVSLDIAPNAFVRQIARDGALALEVFNKKDLKNILGEIRDYSFQPRAEQHGVRGVEQRFSACEEEDIPQTSSVRKLARAFDDAIYDLVDMSETFRTPFHINDHLLIRYPATDIGLSAHRDHSWYRNLIMSVTLSGTAHFNIHDDHMAPPRTTFIAKPGTVIFMRAPGFLEENVRPIHSVTGIETERVSLILKQKEK